MAKKSKAEAENPSTEIASSTDQQNATRTIKIKQRGIISDLEIPVPPAGYGGVVLLRGRNGSGKSTALAIIESILKGGSAVGLKRGAVKGSTEGLGVHINVGARITRRGQLEVTGFAGAENITKFVDPKIKDPEAADAERIRQLLRIANAKISADEWAKAFGDEVREVVKSDPVESATAVARFLQAKAREAEQEAAKHEGAAAMAKHQASATLPYTLLTDGSDAGFAEKTVDDLRKMLGECNRERETAIVEKRNAELEVAAKEAAAEEARKAAEQLKAEEAKSTGNAAEVKTQVATVNLNVDKAVKKIEEIRKQLNDEELLLKSLEQQRTQLLRDLDAIESHQKSLAGLREKIAAGSGEVDRTRLNLATENCKSKEQAAIRVDHEIRRREFVRQAEDESAAKETAAEGAKFYRQKADEVDNVLAEAVKGIASGVRISKGRLWAKNTAGEDVYVAELSPGECTSLAIEIAANSANGGQMGGLEQEAWESLDTENRQKVIDKMIGKGILLFTAVADSGPLRAEILASGKSAEKVGESADTEESVDGFGGDISGELTGAFAPAGEVLVEDF